jgi:nitroreductase
MQLVDAIKNRKSIRRYSHKKPDWRKILQAIDLVRFSPSAGNLYSMKFILVSDKKKIEVLAKASQQEFVGKAHYVVVAVSDDTRLVRSYNERGTRYASLQAGASIQNLLLALTEKGLATTWVGHFYDGQVKEVLEIPEHMNVEGIFPIGIETEIKTRERLKPELENIIYFDKWKETKMTPETRISFEGV